MNSDFSSHTLQHRVDGVTDGSRGSKNSNDSSNREIGRLEKTAGARFPPNVHLCGIYFFGAQVAAKLTLSTGISIGGYDWEGSRLILLPSMSLLGGS